jgi:hypothetical protein
MKYAIRRLLLLSTLGGSLASGGLVSHYTFDETGGTTATDSGPAGANGTIGANVTLGTAGKFGTAFTFHNDATQAGIVDMGDATGLFGALTTSQAVTVSVWLNWTTAGARDSAVFLGDNTVSNRYLDVGTVAGTAGVYGRARNGVNSGFPDLTPAIALNDGQWHHVAYTVDAAAEVTQIYVDGVLAGSSTTTPAVALPSPFNNFEVGRLGRSAPTDAYEGSIDELKIFDTVLSAAEIQTLAQGSGGDPSLLIAATVSFTGDGQSETLSIPFSNGGTSQTLVLTAPTPITISGPDAGSFTVSSYDNNLLPETSGQIGLGFTPLGSGIYNATLTIASNDSLQPSKEVAISVEVIDPVAVVTPTAIDFGSFDEVSEPQTSTLTITNDGGASDLTVYEMTVVGSTAFTTDATIPFSVPPGGSADVTVSFNPGSAEGNFAANLEVFTDGYNQSFFSVPLAAAVKLSNPDASLVSHFTFDNQASLGDDSGAFDNDGTPVGDAQWTSSARIGTGALLLDGTGDLIDLGVESGPDYTTALVADSEGFTVACWAHVPTATAGDRTRFFSAYANGAATLSEGWGVGRRNSTRQLVGTTYGKVDYLAPANTAPATGAWHHYAYVFRNAPVDRIDFYIDGVLVDSRTATNTGINDPVTVGFAIGALGRPTAFEGFDGRLDDLRIYSRELAGGNIADLHDAAPQQSDYELWAAGYGLDPSGNGAYLEDPDGDGIPNSIEFLLGSSPVSGVAASLPLGTKTGNDLVFVYQRKTAATAAGFVDSVEFTDDTADIEWTTAVNGNGGVTISISPVDAETEEVTVSIPSPGTRMFARLTVTAPQ